ncbi:transporter [Comamonas serinivorans]|uniref:Osmotically-inducible protein Y n=1 Tax=Comamonas serinivorans TaxID=1082851 RepID=A0A1Y0ES25_9BURK|nr:BON domain-containing protein [Comamonas serinivorans]ARU06052.1 transporter [Comamonas serinivorans]
MNTVRKIPAAWALATALAVGVTGLAGCSVARHQQTAGEFVDDAAITTKIKAAFAEDKTVAATSISVETLNGEVQLSGFAKSEAERSRAADIARATKGVKRVKNAVEVRR